MKNIYALKTELDGLVGLKELTESLNYMSAAKMMKIRDQVIRTRTFLQEALKTQVELQRHIVLLNRDTMEQLKKKKKKKTGLLNPKVLVLAIMSDQGLCGIFNSQLARKVQADFADQDVDLIILGKKGRSYFSNSPMAKNMMIYPVPKADDIAMFQELINSQYGTVYIYFNLFLNPIKTEPTGMLYKSLSDTKTAEKLTKIQINEDEEEIDKIAKSFVVEPSADEADRYFQTVISEAVMMHQIQESQLSENNARMLAMKEASDNIEELVKAQKKLLSGTRRKKINQALSELFGAMMLNN